MKWMYGKPMSWTTRSHAPIARLASVAKIGAVLDAFMRKASSAGAPIAPATAQSGHRLLGAACDDARGLPAHALCTKHGACMGRCEVCERMLAFWHANGCRGSPCSDDRFGRGQKLKSTLDCWDAFTDMQRGGLLVESSPADEYRLQDCAQIRNVRKTCELWNFC